MIRDSTSFVSHTPSLGHHKIIVASGSSLIVVGESHITLIPSPHLTNVFHVPKLTTNLISISKLTKDLCYIITFSNNHRVFQN